MNRVVNNDRQPRTAFTLVELLVVIAIISVLAALLVPVLRKALDTAHTVDCLSRARQMAVAMSFYMDDYADDVPWVSTEGTWNMPPMGWYPSPPWGSPQFLQTFSNMPGQLMEYELGRQYPYNADPRKTPANFWFCPELPVGMKSATAAMHVPVLDSGELNTPRSALMAEKQRYALNQFLNFHPNDKIVIWARRSRILRPSRTLLIAESDGQKGHDDWIRYDHAAGGPGYCLGERHLGRTRGNILFVDGHAISGTREDTTGTFDWR